jgi:hypothetical protein
MSVRLPKFIVTSVVRGSRQGESHGGVYTVDFEKQEGARHIDWNTADIDWEGRGADRGLRGIAFDGADIFIAASDELFVYDRNFKVTGSHRNRYLKHAHEICRMENRLFVTSTGFDSILSFNLETREFDWGFHLQRAYENWTGYTFDPRGDLGPRPVNEFHVNMVHADSGGIFLSGLRTNALLRLGNRMDVKEVSSLPGGVHNAQPWRDGVLFNDTASDCVRFVPRQGREQAFRIHRYDERQILNAGIDDSNIARQAFGRGLCVVDDRFVAGGSSPSTITLYDLHANQVVGSVNLTLDIRNAVHGLEVWPYRD